MTLHSVVGMPLVAIGSIAGFLITGIDLRHLESWRSIGTYSIAASLAFLALIIVMFGTWTLGIGGLTERVVLRRDHGLVRRRRMATVQRPLKAQRLHARTSRSASHHVEFVDNFAWRIKLNLAYGRDCRRHPLRTRRSPTR